MPSEFQDKGWQYNKYFHNDKKSIPQKDNIQNAFALRSKKSFEIHEAKLVALKGGIDKFTIMVGILTVYLSN